MSDRLRMAKKIVDRIISDLKDRKGLREEFYACDQSEIRSTWVNIIMDELP